MGEVFIKGSLMRFKEWLKEKTDLTQKDFVDMDELKMGIEVEKEHTNDVELAKQIALDHLKEVPDYYTRLKKMEKEAGVK